MENRKLVIVDSETGNIVQELRPKTQQQLEYAARKRKKEAAKTNEPRFIACHSHELREINKELSLIEAGAAMRLLGFLRWKQEGKLIDQNKPMKVADFAKAFKRGESQTKAILKRLEQVGLVSKAREGRANAYFINPRFFQFGGKIGTGYFTKLYVVKSRDLVSELTLQEAGLLFKIIPYFHYENCYLCENPDEQNADNVEHMSRDTLAKHIGVDPDTVSKYMNALKRKGAILTTESRGSTRYLVNPDLLFSRLGDTEETLMIRKLFKQHEQMRMIH